MAVGYKKAAVASQQAADLFKLAAESNCVGKEKEERRWIDKGMSLQKQADYQKGSPGISVF
ncbi:MAG: hypothetical protein A3F67_03940 [Verrucomicrobia bacterium RIFCSPHIGHO2_12_FULL_41_10]|nr:MAG: hypothetical protein A3F67_03940 [Verrucomicrobia bacterium RIFCSPHIGHO2_12_FULL_41_10]HLB32912.1 hypothetical protein [Chthoniobacterales bacterium]